MKNLFSKAISIESNKTKPEIYANAFKSTNDSLVDLFGVIGSLRSRNKEEVEDLFARAHAEDPLMAIKMAFYARNIRGGLGERETFRTIIHWLAINHPQQLICNLDYIPHFGRWDDMYALIDTPVENNMWTIVAHQFLDDIEGLRTPEARVSLLGKWLKSANASSEETRRLGRLTAKKLGLSPKQYRVALTKLRERIRIVESQMSANKWEEIEFSEVPSKAMMNYRDAFQRRQPERFDIYMQSLADGDTKINAGALFPYEILERAELREDYSGSYYENYFKINDDAVLEAQWKALPNYVEEPANFLVMADTSGSMTGRPMATSISLAIYFAERNRGAFHNQFMTFSRKPQFVEVKGNSLKDKVSCIESIIDNTDLERAFREILSVATLNSVPQEDMPKSLIVISDGEIDSFASSRSHWSFLSNMQNEFESAGYYLPKVVMWNVASRGDRFIDTINNPNIQFISGSSPSSFKALINGQNFTAQELMYKTLNDEIYSMIHI
jgi:hypothetical protein